MILSKTNNRIQLKHSSKRLDSFYRSITNSKANGRGRDMILLRPNTFYNIAITIQKLQIINKHKHGSIDIAQVLNSIRAGTRFSDLNVPISRYILTSYLDAAVNILQLDVHNRKITLNTVYTSGKMNETANIYNFDIEYECWYYNIHIV